MRKLNPLFSQDPNQMSGNEAWQHYEQCLKYHDWNYQRSDDSSYYHAGATERSYILMMRRGLTQRDEVRADELFNTYHPRKC